MTICHPFSDTHTVWLVFRIQSLVYQASLAPFNTVAMKDTIFFDLVFPLKYEVDSVVLVCPLTAYPVIIVSVVERADRILGDILAQYTHLLPVLPMPPRSALPRESTSTIFMGG